MQSIALGYLEATKRKEYALDKTKHYKLGYLIGLGRIRDTKSLASYWKAYERAPDKF